MDVFAKNWDHQILHRTWNGRTWSEWEDLGPANTDDNLAAVSPKPGVTELSGRGRNNRRYRRTYTADDSELDTGGETDPS
ncbi:hypothetical protein ACPC27_31300 [Streptomyces cellulosae]